MKTSQYNQHDLAVKELAAQVCQFHKAQVPFRINHGSTNSTRHRDPKTPQLHIAHLKHVLEIDTTARVATVEPNVPLDALVSQCLPLGFMPLVVMEFPGITVGGGFSGASGESTGWKEGLFDCSISEVEMILGNGEVICAKHNGVNSDLFDAARCTLGTMGVITLLEVRLTEVKDAVQLEYHHTKSVGETVELIARKCDNGNADFEFIEGVQYSMNHGVVITGHHVSQSPTVKDLPRTRFDRAIDPWFYMHARETRNHHMEIVPTQSYLFRHDRGAFWSGESALRYFGLPNNRFVRWLLNPVTKARAIYKAMLAGDTADTSIVQDLLLPLNASEAFVTYVGQELKIWPVWICPILKKSGAEDIVGWPFYKTHNDAKDAIDVGSKTKPRPSSKDELTLNFGVWGPIDPDPTAVRTINRGLEQKLRELHGMKVPYAANHYTEEEFWELYDREKYDGLRKKWHAEALPNMYDKVRRKQDKHDERPMQDGRPEKMTMKERIMYTWPLGGLYQMYRVFSK